MLPPDKAQQNPTLLTELRLLRYNQEIHALCYACDTGDDYVCLYVVGGRETVEGGSTFALTGGVPSGQSVNMPTAFESKVYQSFLL